MKYQCRGSSHTEELLGAAALLNNLNNTRLELLNGRNMVGQDTHLTRSSRDVDLNDVLGSVDGLSKVASISRLARFLSRGRPVPTKRVGGQLHIENVRNRLHFVGDFIPGEAETETA